MLAQVCLGCQRQGSVSVSWRSISGLCIKQFMERCRSCGSKSAKHPWPLEHKRWRQISCDNKQCFRCYLKGTPTPLLSLRRLAMHSSVLLKSVTPLPSPRSGLLCEIIYLPLACCFLHCSEGPQPFPALDLQPGTDTLLPWCISATLPAQQIVCQSSPSIRRYWKLSYCLLMSSRGFLRGPGSHTI